MLHDEIASASPSSHASSSSAGSSRCAILTINVGSSSLKFALFERANPLCRILSGEIERIGVGTTTLRVALAGAASTAERVDALDLETAGRALLTWLDEHADLSALAAVGHRIVHGGRYSHAQLIRPSVIDELRRTGPLDSDHMPAEVAITELFLHRFPRVPHVACFDTSFHRRMPRIAQLFAIPEEYARAGLLRYGFHGLSYTYLLEELAHLAGADVARRPLVLAHLGAGSSMAAVREGIGVDTTMSLTPTAGLPMGTRAGDLDPGLLIYFFRQGMTAGQLDELVNRRSGLLGLSGTSSDMKDLLDREATDPRAGTAIELYCRQAAKYAAAMAVSAGGIDTLVFSAGIGERSAAIRARICARLALLGIRIDAAKNSVGAPIISAADSPVTVRVIATNEEISIAQETLAMLLGSPNDDYEPETREGAQGAATLEMKGRHR